MKKIFILSLIAFALSACEDKSSSRYLLTHLDVLKEQAIECQSGSDSPQCEKVMQLATQVSNLIDKEQQDPETLGQHALEEQMELAKLKSNMQADQAALNELIKKNADQAKVQAAQDKLNAAQKAYQNKKEELQVLLAVLGLSSPD